MELRYPQLELELGPGSRVPIGLPHPYDEPWIWEEEC